MPKTALEILQQHSLRITKCRLDILDHFIKREKAYTLVDLENEYQQHDRATVYRTIVSLQKEGVLHKIPNDSGKSTYALTAVEKGASEKYENHIHFKCNQCGQIECLKDLQGPNLSLPEGYQVMKINYLAEGFCLDCKR